MIPRLKVQSAHNRVTVPNAQRRRFLKQTLFGAAMLSVGGLFSRCTSALIPSASPHLTFCDAHEFAVLQAIVESMIGRPLPADGPTVEEITLRADAFLAGTDHEVQEQFHQLLTVFNGAFFTFIFDFRFSSFLNMTPEDRDSYLGDWMTSSLAVRRTGFQGLKRLSLSVYYSLPASWTGSGFDGEFAEPS